MKQFGFLLLWAFSLSLGAQVPCIYWEDPKPDLGGTNYAGSGNIQLSTTLDLLSIASNVVDGDINTVARTRNEASPFIQISMDERRFVPFVRILSNSAIQDFYLFVSDDSIAFEANIDSLLGLERVVAYQYYNYTSGDTIWTNTAAQFLRIQLRSAGVLTIGELHIPGGPMGVEICNNSIDDNCDGKIDCDDIQCGAKIFNAYGIDASCPICNTGEIHIQPTFGRNLEFSIDGGITFSDACWDSFERMCFWSELQPGEYNLQIRNSVTGCTYEHPNVIIIRSPGSGPDNENCENGGFENGNFLNWEGAIGINDNPNNPPRFTDFFLDINDNHSIINTTLDLPDPIAPAIDGNYPGLGMYVAKLGTDYAGLEAEYLEYCFDVTQDNADFYFTYALVFEHPSDHYLHERPFFQWFIYIEGTNIPFAGDKIYSTLDHGFEQTTDIYGNLITYKGWTCQSVNLSGFIGNRVCARFITADCTEYDHFAYAYIDGLCSSAEELLPHISILPNKTLYCEGDIVKFDVVGSGYSSYIWTVSKLDINGNEFEIVHISRNGADASISNLIEFYENNSQFSLDCNSRVKARLQVENSCGGEAVKDIIIEFECLEGEIHYCDTIFLCNPMLNQRILGINNCDDCTVQWQPAPFLVLDDPKFPLVLGQQFPNAYNQIYYATILGPNGCEISKMPIRFYDATKISIDISSNIAHCYAEFDATIDLKTNIAFGNFKAFLYDQISNEEFEMNLLPSSSKRIRNYKFSIDRAIDRKLTLIARFIFNEDCAQSELCEIQKDIGVLPKSNYTGNWIVLLPNIFAPGSGNPNNNKWYPGFYSEDLNCENPSAYDNNVYRMKVQFWDRWGGLMWEKEVIKGVFDTQGVIYTDMMWDGKVNGQIVGQGVYVCKVWIYSCYGIAGVSSCYAPQCPCSGLGPEDDCVNNYVCSEEEENLYIYDVTIL